MKQIVSKAVVYAFGVDGLIVHSQILDLHQFYDSQQLFDSRDRIKAAGIVRLVGMLFDENGNIVREFEQTYDEHSGELSGARDYSYREHLKPNGCYLRTLALFEERRKQRDAHQVEPGGAVNDLPASPPDRH